MESGSLRANPRAIAFGILRELSLICHPEERSDEGSAAAFSNLTAKQKNSRGSFTTFRMTNVVRKDVSNAIARVRTPVSAVSGMLRSRNHLEARQMRRPGICAASGTARCWPAYRRAGAPCILFRQDNFRSGMQPDRSPIRQEDTGHLRTLEGRDGFASDGGNRRTSVFPGNRLESAAADSLQRKAER
jgi:hypothetical protein